MIQITPQMKIPIAAKSRWISPAHLESWHDAAAMKGAS